MGNHETRRALRLRKKMQRTQRRTLAFVAAGVVGLLTLGAASTAMASEAPADESTAPVVQVEAPVVDDAIADESSSSDESSTTTVDTTQVDQQQGDGTDPESTEPASQPAPEQAEPTQQSPPAEVAPAESTTSTSAKVAPQQQSAAVNYGTIGTLQPNTSAANQASYWKDRVPNALECYKYEGRAMQDNAHAYTTNGGKTVVLKPYGADWPGDHWAALIVKAATWDAITLKPTPGASYAAYDNKDISHYIVCKGETPKPKKDASASVSVTPATCTAPAALVYGDIVNATFSGTPNGTTGPGSYNVVATSTNAATHVFSDGQPTRTFSGTLSDKLPGQSTNPYKPCYTPPSSPTQDVTCEAISADYHRALTNGDHINVTIEQDGTVLGQVNMYVDQNIAGGASYNGQNNLGLRWKILGVEQTPIPLTLEQVQSGVITFNYSASLIQKGIKHWKVTFVQTNSTDTWPNLECGTPPEEPEPEVVTGLLTFKTLSCVEGSKNWATGAGVPGGVFVFTDKNGKTFTTEEGEGYSGGVPEGLAFGDITVQLKDNDSDDKYTVTPWSGTWTTVDPESLDCRVENASASVVVVTNETCDASSTVLAVVGNATLIGELSTEPGEHTATFKAAEGSKFSNGTDTLEVPYTIKDALGYQSEDPDAPCYKKPPVLTPGDITAQCVSDVPWLAYDVTPEGVEGELPENPLTITFVHPTDESQNYVVTGLPLSGRILWPGAWDGSNGAPKEWPGWISNGDGTYTATDGNYRWTREGVTVLFQVNSEYTTVVEYSAADSLCANPPTKTPEPEPTPTPTPTPTDTPKPTPTPTPVDTSKVTSGQYQTDDIFKDPATGVPLMLLGLGLLGFAAWGVTAVIRRRRNA